MVDPNSSLSSALERIKRFVDNWLQESDAIDCNDLTALIDALDCLKKDAQQKLSIRKATLDKPPLGRDSANQGVRRSSRRIVSVSQPSASLFVSEHDTESDSSDDASSVNHTTRIAISKTPLEDPTSSERLIEPSSLMHDTTRTAFNAQDEHIGARPAPIPGREPDTLTHQSPCSEIDTPYQAADNLGYSGNQLRTEPLNDFLLDQPHLELAEQDAPISAACEMELEDGNTEDLEMQDTSTPQFFNEAFEDMFGTPVQHDLRTDIGKATAGYNEEHPMDQNHMESPGIDLVFQSYLDLASRSSFRLPHESVEDAEDRDGQELLLPLVDGRPLTPRLLCGLIYSLVPGPLCVLEVDFGVRGGEFPDESLANNFAVILRQNEEASPLLVLGDKKSTTLFILHSYTAEIPFLDTLCSILPEWKKEYINPHDVEPHLESSLLSVWIAEACFQQRPLQNAPSSRELRLRFLGELLAPFQRDLVLEQHGISSKLAACQPIDTRLVEAHLEMQDQSNEIHVSKLENFDLEALHNALLKKPAEISRGRCLRILQCVYEIGSPFILDSLKSACTRGRQDQTNQAIEQPVVEKLLHIHLYLDSQESQSHILVARNRYIKYCYFETYLLAVAALQKEKRDSNREKRRVSARKLTASFKQGLCEELPPTPHDDEIRRIYEDLSPSEKKRRAQDMVKNEISRKVAKIVRGDEKRIRRNINRYIREGKVLHFILQGGIALNPGLLVLLPSFGTRPPSLSTAEFGIELEESEEKNLCKPFEIRDIDGLTQAEAIWFGKVLQARPGLLEQVPKTILDLISDSLTEALDLHERDVNCFKDRPLRFFT